MIVFFLVGLWHGASWLFVLWGLGNGALIVLERVWLLRWLQRAWLPVQHGWALLVTMVSLAFFRAGNVEQGWSLLKALAGLAAGSGQIHNPALYLNGQLVLALALGALFAAPLYPALAGWSRRALAPRLDALPAAAQAALALPGMLGLAALLVVSAMAVAARTYTPFVYFQF
jgi:alginate O-acetyltransferase complex protein AlgI